MKDLKTTMTGLAFGLPIAVDALNAAYQAGAFTGKSGIQLWLAIGIILLGKLASDSKKPVSE